MNIMSEKKVGYLKKKKKATKFLTAGECQSFELHNRVFVGLLVVVSVVVSSLTGFFNFNNNII